MSLPAETEPRKALISQMLHVWLSELHSLELSLTQEVEVCAALAAMTAEARAAGSVPPVDPDVALAVASDLLHNFMTTNRAALAKHYAKVRRAKRAK